MANDFYIHLFLILFLGGFIGWSLFFFTFWVISNLKNVQIKMIEDIQEDIKHIKSEINDLK